MTWSTSSLHCQPGGSQDDESARDGLTGLVVDLEAEHPDLVAWLDAEAVETLSCFHFPAEHRERIQS